MTSVNQTKPKRVAADYRSRPPKLTARELIASWSGARGIMAHPNAAICPGCGHDMLRVGVVDIAYVYEPCTCDLATYTHIVETLWHRRCFLKSGGEYREPASDKRAKPQ